MSAPSSAGPTGGRVYFAGLDGLRFIAAYAVVLHHCEQALAAWGEPNAFGHPVIARMGGEAVRFFFVLSGYLITYLLLTERTRTGTVAVGRFYLRRVLRIWPLYYLIVAIGLFVGPQLPQLAWPGAYEAIDVGSPVVIALFLTVLPNVALHFYGIVPHASHAWSIGIEEQFYLVWPVLMRLARKPVVAVLGVLCVYPGMQLVLWIVEHAVTIDPSSQAWRILSFVAAQPFHCMALGALAACAHFYGLFAPGRLAARLLFGRPGQLVVYGGLALALAAPISLPWPVEPLLPIGYSLLCLGVSANPDNLLRLDWPWLRKLGQISYGIYMYHAMMILLARAFAVDVLGLGGAALRPALYTFATVGTLAVAAASYRWFEGPMLALKARFEVVASGTR